MYLKILEEQKKKRKEKPDTSRQKQGIEIIT